MRTVLLSLLMASTALADELVLRNGSVFSGVVHEDGDRVTVEMDFGTMTFKKVDVRSISRGVDPLAEFEQKSKAATDVRSKLELAAWAREKGLGGRATDLYRKILTLDPEQADARKALGYEKVNGQWFQGDDILVARGYVKVNGRWMLREDAAQARELEAQARIEADRVALGETVARLRHEEEMAKLSLERERLEALKERQLRESRFWGPRGDWSWGVSPCGIIGIVPPTAEPTQKVPLTSPTVIPLGSPSPVPPTPPSPVQPSTRR